MPVDGDRFAVKQEGSVIDSAVDEGRGAGYCRRDRSCWFKGLSQVSVIRPIYTINLKFRGISEPRGAPIYQRKQGGAIQSPYKSRPNGRLFAR